MSIHRCDPCSSDWKAKIAELWEKYQNVVKVISAEGTLYYPDGDGKVSLPGILSDVFLYDMASYFTLIIDTDVSTMNLIDKTNYWQLTIET